MNILGLSAFYHDSACCLLSNGRLVAAASEERFTRIKHDARLPANAYRYCLREAGLLPGDLDCIAYYENPVKKSGRRLAYFNPSHPDAHLIQLNPALPPNLIREHLGFDGEILPFDHHLSHAASAFYFSGFDRAAILTADGVGEWATTSYGVGENGEISLFETVNFPHSLGLLYAAVTAFLGFRVNRGEYKVMGLAAYGEPIYLDRLRRLIRIGSKGQYRLNMRYFAFARGRAMYSPRLSDLLQLAPRQPESEIRREHENLARSVQALLEEVLLDKLNYLHARTGMDSLCTAGGVALNAAANRRIRRESPFKSFFFQPAAGDAGGALGAAALAHRKLGGSQAVVRPLSSLYLGPGYSNREVAAVLEATGARYQAYIDQEEALIQAVVARLLDFEVIGWFQGRMEFGPRALGARSILANPMDPQAKDRINAVIKKRETFRPFAPTVLWPEAAAHFELQTHTPFMIETCRVRSDLDLPAVTHVDGTARPQTLLPETHPRLHRLITAFYQRTGCPMLVNTSFNQRGEPIVRTPAEALACLGTSDLDALVIQDYLLASSGVPENWPELLDAWSPDASGDSSAQADNLYSLT